MKERQPQAESAQFDPHRLAGQGEAEILARNFSAAEKILGDAARIAPESARIQHLLGVALHEQDKLDRAIACYRKSVKLDPALVEAQRDLGAAFMEKRRYGDALERYREAMRQVPEDALACEGAAAALREMGEIGAARRHFQRALWLRIKGRVRALFGLAPARRAEPPAGPAGQAEALLEQSSALFALGRLEESCREAERALALDPASARAHVAIAAATGALGDFPSAERHCREALGIDPGNARARINLGAALKEQDRLDEARAAYEEAAQVAPRDADLCLARGNLALEISGKVDDALRWYRKAAELRPGWERAEALEGAALLLCGRYGEGWPKYEARKRYPVDADLHAGIDLPEWDGGSLAGRTLLVYGEQGLGDEIMFASCLPDVIRQAARCHVLCSRRLAGLFARSFPAATVAGWRDAKGVVEQGPVPRADLKCAIGSLPQFLRRTRDAFPAHGGYLSADPARVAHWRLKLAQLGPGRTVGLSWRGGVPLTGRRRRSLDLKALEPLLRVPGTRWISFQYTDCRDEIDEFFGATGIRVTHWQEAIDDFEEHAALAAAVDHRVTVCNTFAHLCGSLGLPVWVLAPHVPEWRYGLEAHSMPWYPAARLYRQPSRGDWGSVVGRAERDLRALAVPAGPA